MTHISLLSTWRWAVQSCPGRNPHPSSIPSALGRIGSNRAHSQGETRLLSLVINIDKHTVERCGNKAFRSLTKHIYYKEKCFGASVFLTQAFSRSTPCCLLPSSPCCGITTVATRLQPFITCLHSRGRGRLGVLGISTTCSCVQLLKTQVREVS